MVDKIVSGPALSIEEQYKIDYRKEIEIIEDPEERQLAKRDLWEKFLAGSFLRDGNGEIVYKLQKKLATELFLIIKGFYGGNLSPQNYRKERLAVFQQYCSRMVELGLATATPEDAWIAQFSEEGIAAELELLPAKTTGLTDADALALCTPLRDKSKEVLVAYHTQFGIGKLKEKPDIYIGIDIPEEILIPDVGEVLVGGK
jgi:hypothetical protein